MNFQSNSENVDLLKHQRLDVWLWVGRFYKTRGLAGAAVVAGHVRLNDQRNKPSKSVRIGDQISIKKNQLDYSVIVCGLSTKRLSAKQAQSLYIEPDWSRDKRENDKLLGRKNNLGLRFDNKKPDKHDRKKMMYIKYRLPNDTNE